MWGAKLIQIFFSYPLSIKSTFSRGKKFKPRGRGGGGTFSRGGGANQEGLATWEIKRMEKEAARRAAGLESESSEEDSEEYDEDDEDDDEDTAAREKRLEEKRKAKEEKEKKKEAERKKKEEEAERKKREAEAAAAAAAAAKAKEDEDSYDDSADKKAAKEKAPRASGFKGLPGEEEPEGPPPLSRKEREAMELKAKKEAYLKKHAEGKTPEAQADLARLAAVRKQREEAAKQKELERIKKEEEKKAARR
jgi:hypothetical protein